MATTTTQLALRKPVGSDQVNVTTELSDNMQKIDDPEADYESNWATITFQVQ